MNLQDILYIVLALLGASIFITIFLLKSLRIKNKETKCPKCTSCRTTHSDILPHKHD